MKGIKISLIACVILISSACTMTSSPDDKHAKSAVGDITYKKDERTGLCFAMIQSVTYTWIPCNIACVRTLRLYCKSWFVALKNIFQKKDCPVQSFSISPNNASKYKSNLLPFDRF